MKYILPELPYAYDALEPFIDEKTMKVHHDAHHKTYVDKLNEALKGRPDLQTPVEELLASLPYLPLDVMEAVRENGGGHANHTLFWTMLTPTPQKNPSGSLLEAIRNKMDSVENLKNKFTDVAVHHFASGWAWLCVDQKGEMSVFATRDHDSPITSGLTPLLVLDLWEHAYYLKYQNKRPEFVSAFWNIVNWEEVRARWDEFQNKGWTNREWRIAS